jgi:hypothetical protein
VNQEQQEGGHDVSQPVLYTGVAYMNGVELTASRTDVIGVITVQVCHLVMSTRADPWSCSNGALFNLSKPWLPQREMGWTSGDAGDQEARDAAMRGLTLLGLCKKGFCCSDCTFCAQQPFTVCGPQQSPVFLPDSDHVALLLPNRGDRRLHCCTLV